MNVLDRRNYSRLPFSSKGCVIVDGVDVDIWTHDISHGGALVEFISAFANVTEGMELPVYLNVGFIGKATVCRTVGSNNCVLYGLRFDRFDFRTSEVLGAFISRLKEAPLHISTFH